MNRAKNLLSWIVSLFKSKSTTAALLIPPKTLSERLLQRSYFPNQRPAEDELPPIFSSLSFTRPLGVQLARLVPKRSNGFDAVEYRLTRSDGQIRASHIPHPAAYAHLIVVLEKHWAKLPDIFNNHESYIRPRNHPDGRVVIMKYDSWLTKTLKSLKWQSNSKYIAVADISNFFPSVYTHSLGWAIDGIQNAKTSKGQAWYDELDRAFRLTKRNETNGVLIGPATSNIATEIILGKVDEKLRKKNYRFYRHIDDYRCYCLTKEEAESFHSDLTRFIGYFKLYLNTKKSKILKLPATTDDPWVMEVRSQARGLGKRPKSGQISLFLDQVIEIEKRHGDANAYKYAATVLSSKTLSQNSKVTAFIKLLGLSQFAPNLTSTLFRFLPDQLNSRIHELGPVLLGRIPDAVRSNRSDVVSWLLFLCAQLNEPIPKSLAMSI